MGKPNKRRSVAIPNQPQGGNGEQKFGGGRVNKRKMKKSKSAPNIKDNQEEQVPSKMKDFIRTKEELKQPMKNKQKEKLPLKEKLVGAHGVHYKGGIHFRELPKIEEEKVNTKSAYERMFGETDYQMNKRLDEEVRAQIRNAKLQPDVCPELEDEKEKKRLKRKEKNKAKQDKKNEKKMKRKSDMFFKKKEKEVFKNEKVGFQEVVHKPPSLRTKPKGAKNLPDMPAKKRYSFMSMFSTDGKKFIAK